MRLNKLLATCFVMAVLVAAAQDPLPAATKIEPGSLDSGFAPTAYAEANRAFEDDIREFDAVQRGMAEIAEAKASPAVQAFAKQVRTEFTGEGASLKGMSDDKGVPLVGTARLTREHQTLVAQLGASSADVDRLFVDFEVLILREVMGVVQAYALGGTDARLRQAAAEAVSADNVLLATARTLQKP